MAKAQSQTTIQNDDIDFGDAEDFKLPSDGVHNANLANAELVITKKTMDLPEEDQREQFVVTTTLSPDDPDAPNLPMRNYYGWPYPEDRDILWGSRTAYGAKIQGLKELSTAFGGPESGAMKKHEFLAFLQSKVGMACKIRVKQSRREDQPDQMQANVSAILPA